VIAAVVGLLISQSTGKGTKVATTVPTTTPSTTPVHAGFGSTACPKADGSSVRRTSFPAPPQKCIVDGKTYTAAMVTDAGTMTIALDVKRAPITVNNFVFLARYHFFDGLKFHRVVPGFVDQGGDPKGDGTGGPGYQFVDELPASGAYKVGSMAMANNGANTNGSQFFIIVGAQGTQLPPSYSLFGMVTQGIDVAHKIEADGAADPSPPKVVHKMLTVTISES
jgi:cyclophilin family peptidyl-prolyl cis-trans isomerase